MTPARTTTTRAYAALAAGLLKRFASTDTLTLGSKTYTRDELVAIFQRLPELSKITDTAYAQWLTAVHKEKAYLAQTHRLRATAQQLLLAVHGGDGVALADFGLKAPKKSSKSAATKTVAAQKAQQTRKRLGTMGKKQRKKAAKG